MIIKSLFAFLTIGLAIGRPAAAQGTDSLELLRITCHSEEGVVITSHKDDGTTTTARMLGPDIELALRQVSEVSFKAIVSTTNGVRMGIILPNGETVVEGDVLVEMKDSVGKVIAVIKAPNSTIRYQSGRNGSGE